MQNEFKGWSLFNDIENESLRFRNRAVVLANMAQDNMKNRMINHKGAALILGYFREVPDNEKKATQDAFVNQMKERGFAIVAN